MNLIENLIQYLFIGIILILLCIQQYFIANANRAAHQTKIPIPFAWKIIMLAYLLFSLLSLMFIIFYKP